MCTYNVTKISVTRYTGESHVSARVDARLMNLTYSIIFFTAMSSFIYDNVTIRTVCAWNKFVHKIVKHYESN